MIVRLVLVLFLVVSVAGPWSVAALTARAASGGGFGAPASKSAVVVKVDTSPEIATLHAFLQAQKASLNHVQVGRSARHGRGLFATKAFTKPGQIMCRIPSDCALAVSDPAAHGKDVPTVAHQGANLCKLYWKDAAQRQQWAPYLDTLPTEAGSSVTPDFWTNEEISLLEFPPLVQAVLERKQQMALVAREQGYSVEEVQFAAWLVSSRSFPLAVSTSDDDNKDDDDDKVPSIAVDERGQVLAKTTERASIRVLLPWLDLANHDSNAPNARMTIIDPHKEAAWFALEVLKPIAKGQEILVSYGSGVESSVALLQNYGFVPDQNRMDYLMLRHLHQQSKQEDIGNDSGDGDGVVQDFPLEAYSTSLEEDERLLAMAKQEGEPNLTKILAFRVQLKQSYPSVIRSDKDSA
jgi:hypothetical protein